MSRKGEHSFLKNTKNLSWFHVYDFQLMSRTSSFERGTARLMWGIITELAQHRLHCRKDVCKDCQDDEEWLLQGDGDFIFSLENVCWVLRLSVGVVRHMLLELKSNPHSGQDAA